MREQINKVINDHFRRQFESVGARYFDKEFLTVEMLNDQQLVRDIIGVARELSTTDKRVKQTKGIDDGE